MSIMMIQLTNGASVAELASTTSHAGVMYASKVVEYANGERISSYPLRDPACNPLTNKPWDCFRSPALLATKRAERLHVNPGWCRSAACFLRGAKCSIPLPRWPIRARCQDRRNRTPRP